METLWYALVVFVFTAYVVLDGYDFGVGILSPLLAKNERDRRLLRETIGPFWTGNEVWVIAGSALLFLAFPKAFAAGFSGFYLALMILLWLLMGRGLAFELREHVNHELWRRFWDAIFFLANLLLAFVVGLVVGNLLRGVPLNANGDFFLALWTDLTPGPLPGLLDWFTLLTGLAMAALLMLQGASFLVMKTRGELQARAEKIARAVTGLLALLLPALVVALPSVQPSFGAHYEAAPIGYVWPLAVVVALVVRHLSPVRRRPVVGFAASSLVVAALLIAAAWGTFPNLLLATTDRANSLTILNAATERSGLEAGLWWVPPGLALVMLYQLAIHRFFGGPVTEPAPSSTHH
ncbi:cytochrome d ubiquinol oxidase subunit II [Nitrospirales bacterium NOB]|nr:MAG: cytochrome bd oxidase subunit II [Nitrospira sp. OLB3]MBV6470576.1 Cytochrome bd-I ubiquinol oxidase subunit 2 [Nitrospirota bacterium]MCE7965396.1 cytochrome d ubiquinol oxidase subunit II [Nitrospira sp. NTP2]MCK6493020.1 cytochrome d ubiquinol oxidase subunit II [Nitrospira sp.]MDL1889790.1 cytochrome d ubiquinol oxidase subunit II [Nitrospirales bacterium NOB]MEB2338367.1 cytochrome d ubiquinol oxidase subunit II [Nitrospirales bacterium]